LTGNGDAAFSLFLANNQSECRKRCGLRTNTSERLLRFAPA
jgi:hypothetical protein